VASPNLPTNIDSSYADSATDASAKLHQQYHDTIHALLNQFDVAAVPSDGQAWVYVAAAGLYRPLAVSGGGSVDLSAVPWIVSAATGGTGAYPARPATTRPVIFRGINAPTLDGSTSGGGGVVPGLDSWMSWSSAAPAGGGWQSGDGLTHTLYTRTAAQGAPPNTLGSDGDLAVVALS
jgi:hypothetical protein